MPDMAPGGELVTKKTVSTFAVLVIGTALAALGWASPAQAAEKVTFEAAVPCTAVCSYWLEDLVGCIGCNPDGLTRQATRSAGYDQPVYSAHEHVDTCDKPTPPGSYDEEMIGQAPNGASGLEFRLEPLVDWDGFICAKRGPTADEARANPLDTKVRWRVEAQAAHSADEPCENQIGVPEATVGCYEEGTASVRPGIEYKLIAYNWSDVPTADGFYAWICPSVCQNTTAAGQQQAPSQPAPKADSPAPSSGGGDAKADAPARRSGGSSAPARVRGVQSSAPDVETMERQAIAAETAQAEALQPQQRATDSTDLAAARLAEDAKDTNIAGLLRTMFLVIAAWAALAALGFGAYRGLKHLRA